MSAAQTIQRVLTARRWSRDRVAAEFVARYRFQPPDKQRSPRSFAAEIRKLEGGDPTWFVRRPPAARLIAEILESTPAQLGIAARDELVSFVDFPELPALDLAREDPFGVESWRPLLDEARAHPIWLSAGPGTGKTMFARWAEKRGLAIRIEARSLAAAEGEVASALAGLGERPGVVLVDVIGAAPEDLGAQRRLDRPRLLVLSTEPRPHGGSGGEGPRAAGIEPGAWADHEVTSTTFDRRGFVDWIARRLPDTPGIGERLWRTLVDFDPTGALIATPGDLIPFLGAVFERRTVDTVDELIHRAASRIGSRWLASHGRDLFRSLALARWLDLRYPYGRPAPRDAWEQDLPSGLVAPREREAIRSVLAAFRKQRNLRIDEVAERLLQDRRTTVVLLEDARVLGREPDGQLGLRPRWLAHAEVVEAVREILASDPARACRVAVDATRRDVLDHLLVELKDRPWQRFLEAAVRACRGDDLGSIAVVESAFAAAARRHDQGRPTNDREALGAILSRQLELLVARDGHGPPGPITRPGAEAPDGASFLADCWTWSLMLARPSGVALAEAWLFPGWAPRAPGELAGWLHLVERTGAEHARARLQRMLATLLETWPPSTAAWPHPPGWVWLGLLAHERAWPVDPAPLRSARTEAELARRLDGLAADRATAVLRKLWRMVSTWGLWDVVPVLDGPLGRRLLETFDPRQVAAALPMWAPEAMSRMGRVPAPLRGPLIAWLLDHDDVPSKLRMQDVEHLGADDHAILVRLADDRRGWPAIQRLWQVAPELASHELERRLADGRDVSRWLEGPAAAMDAIIAIVERHPALPSAVIHRWATGRMLQHPWLAERLWALASIHGKRRPAAATASRPPARSAASATDRAGPTPGTARRRGPWSPRSRTHRAAARPTAPSSSSSPAPASPRRRPP
ncbi:MAG TPA: hypothetical protein VN253_25440 [Kofleriaceae bacterium]|nr:hypothetical protein [Kofleriaceae bacterium]